MSLQLAGLFADLPYTHTQRGLQTVTESGRPVVVDGVMVVSLLVLPGQAVEML
jgi:hypothetical protein